ncbi:TetR/AcrR family transcriptional regulator [Rufibacter quisquiliarum]|uniref:AcrR family transcriptional regulator n=1 Tax=Rufibacter quisquiliarum TaxID=1549639 RepID=A0A839GRB1_9BACT|nr:TetR/AcrR family transcriptional regulator [Rufibacter quisquiliarum]MBA9077396.1 AcrR family transcriptional regulator [Rufibacter quisquiliarum]
MFLLKQLLILNKRSINMSKRVLQRETSVHAILEAAVELFAEHGFEGTSIRQIAVKAGISLGLLYNYFSSKEELLKAIILRGRKSEKLEKPEGLTPFQALEHQVRNFFQELQQQPTYWRLLYLLRLQPSLKNSLGAELEKETQAQANSLVSQLAAAGSHSPSAEAALMLATLDGIAQQYLTVPNFPLQDVMIRYLLQLKNHLNA